MAKAKQQAPGMNAVIYARYSSHAQTEQSIEGQLHDSHAFADRHGYRVIAEYVDRAQTGTRDDRPEFQRMIRDAEKRQFQFVIVWKLDRFARNRYDSAFYKAKLKKYGVRVISVMENIPDAPEGIILEGLLESMAEFYSANLSQNIRRGQQESIAKGWFLGGPVPYGYRVEDHRLVPDPDAAPIVREIFERYAAGEGKTLIVEDLNRRGIYTASGGRVTVNTLRRLLQNPAYVGRYTYGGREVPGCSAALISEELFARAGARLDRNRRAPAAGRSQAEYLLQGKLFCGVCGMPVTGDFGTSKTGHRYYYYTCSGRRRKLTGCRKHPEKVDFLEWYVCEQTVEYILEPERMDLIADAVVRIYESEHNDSVLAELEQRVKRLDAELNVLVGRLGTVPDQMVPRITQRMEEAQAELAESEAELYKLRLQAPVKITKKEVTAWLSLFRRGDLFDRSFRVKVIDTFINSVYIWDDKLVILYNITGAMQTCYMEPLSPDEIEKDGLPVCSELPVHGGPPTLNSEPPAPPYLIYIRGMLGLVLFR